VLGIDPSRCALLLTEPMLNFPQVRAAMEQVGVRWTGRRGCCRHQCSQPPRQCRRAGGMA
jgi:hypothetical protein